MCTVNLLVFYIIHCLNYMYVKYGIKRTHVHNVYYYISVSDYSTCTTLRGWIKEKSSDTNLCIPEKRDTNKSYISWENKPLEYTSN